MKKDLDIRNDVATRNYHITKRFWYFIYRNVMRVVGRHYNAHYEKIDKISDYKGACFLIFNHLSRIDHAYTTEIAYPRRVNMLCAYNEFFRSHLHFAFKHNNVLPKKQYVNDILSTRIISKMIKKGACISFAPEGLASNDGMNKPIVPGTGHMLKHYKVPVFFVRLQGQYLQNTKVCLDERYGETYATSKLLFSKEDLGRLSAEEIEDIINESFRNDEYAWQKEKHIKWTTNDRICYHLEQILYRCPKCGAEFMMEGNGDKIVCHNCGNGATMDEYYDFHPFDETCVIPETVSEWVRQERIKVIHEIREDKNYEFTERVKIGRLPNNHYIKDHKTSEIVGEGLLTINHQGFSYCDDAKSELNFTLDWKSLYTLITMLDSSYLNLYVNGEYTDLFPQDHECFMKINLLVEEMHRYHVNFYKNFKWNEYMYDGVEKMCKE